MTHAAHWKYWRGIAERGSLISGGPWIDSRGEILVINVDNNVSLRRILSDDPYTQGGLVADTVIREWSVTIGQAASGRARREPVISPLNSGRGLRLDDRNVPTRQFMALTPHQRRIAQMMLDGMTNREIAQRFSVSCRAIEQHITQIYRKLSIKRRAQLAAALPRGE